MISVSRAFGRGEQNQDFEVLFHVVKTVIFSGGYENQMTACDRDGAAARGEPGASGHHVIKFIFLVGQLWIGGACPDPVNPGTESGGAGEFKVFFVAAVEFLDPV
jgi:hypothetical protein